MALYHCDRCNEHFVGRAGLVACPWCKRRVHAVLDGTDATEQEHALQRQHVLLDRIAGVLFDPADRISDAERIVEARRVLAQMAPEFVPPR